MGDRPIPRFGDLYIGSMPPRGVTIQHRGAPLDVTGFQFRAQLLLAPNASGVLLTIPETAFSIIDAAKGQIAMAFPELTEANTGGRDNTRTLRLQIWNSTDPIGGPPREQFDFVVAIR